MERIQNSTFSKFEGSQISNLKSITGGLIEEITGAGGYWEEHDTYWLYKSWSSDEKNSCIMNDYHECRDPK